MHPQIPIGQNIPPNRQQFEQLLIHDVLDPKDADDASNVLGIYPTRHTWLEFFDKALLIIGSVCLVLALVFFIAYNWFYMDKMGKFALVEGVLVISVLAYAVLAYKQKFRLVQQLLLLIASVVTGSLIALFGQVYQTGADTWQLFFNWALLITPFVILARLPALWLLWLGLVNASIIMFLTVNTLFISMYSYHEFAMLFSLFILNFVAYNLWLLLLTDHVNGVKTTELSTTKTDAMLSSTPSSSAATQYISHHGQATRQLTGHHWSTYILGLIVTYFASKLGVAHESYWSSTDQSLFAFIVWVLWALFMYWCHYKRQIDLLMLTYVCGSIIYVVMVSSADVLFNDGGGMLLFALLLIAMSSASVFWLRRVAEVHKSTHNYDSVQTHKEH